MTNLNFANFARGLQATAPTNNASTEKRPQPKVWLNVGISIPTTKPDGTTDKVFVSLPLGIGIDTMEEMPMRGSSAEWHHMVQAKNFLLAELQAAGAKLPAGQSIGIEGLEIQLRRVGEAEAPAAGENPLLAALQGKVVSAA